MKSKIHRKSKRTRKMYGGWVVPTNYVYSNTNEAVQLWDVIGYIK